MPYMKKNEADNIKKQVCAVFNNNADWRGLANTLGVTKSTAYRWVKNQDALMSQYIEENPRLTLKELKRKFEEEHQIVVSTECLRKHLDGLMFTLKDIRREPERTNSEENKIRRRDYVQQLLYYQADNIPVIYMDGTNFNLLISRKQGPSKKGTRCSYIAAGSRGANVHVIGCIGNMGLIHHEIRRGAFRKPEAKEFVRNCPRIAQDMYQTPVLLVIDNAPCHADLEEIFREEEFVDHRLLRLSPYSPMFNPIGLAWSSLKAAVKRDLATQLPQILAGVNRVDLPQNEFRLRQLENLIRENIHVINVNNCARYVAHIQKFIPDASNLVNMVV